MPVSGNAFLHWLPPRRLMAASAAVACAAIALKALAWQLTGSVGLLSDALESVVNLAGAGFGLLMLTVASRPADEGHPYGHYKAEYFASAFEGLLILAAAAAIAWAALPRLAQPQPVALAGWGLALAVGSSALNGALAWLMLRAARVHRSLALQADARHLLTDVWTSAGVLAGVLLAPLTGWLWLDPLMALLVALNILREGFGLLWRSSQGLMDEAVQAETLAQIQAVLARFEAGGVARFDHVRTRQAGQRRFADLHMHLPPEWTLTQAAALRAQVAAALAEGVPGLCALIQILPPEPDEAAASPSPEESRLS